jgi:ribosomal protein S18 acetylase RimI-like enzyme
VGESQPGAERIVFLKAVVNGKIIGSVRGYAMGQTAHIRRMIVHPYFRGRGIGRRLLKEIENAFPEVQRFQAKTGHQSKRNLFQLTRSGYQVFRTEPFTEHINWVYLRKDRTPALATTKGAT